MDIDGWPIVQEKSSGITPGYRVTDPEGHLYQVKFDPPTNPEMASGAEVIGAAIYHAIGYNVVAGLHRGGRSGDASSSRPTATTVDMSGRKKTMTRDDVDKVLRARREAAERAGTGRRSAALPKASPLGYFKYYGTGRTTRTTSIPHEHRRELRANRVFASWLNHDDSRGINSLDMLDGPAGRQAIRHYMFDFGSTLGSGSTVAAGAARRQRVHRRMEARACKTAATLGLWVRPWIKVDYPKVAPSVGRFEADFFDPALWRPEYPNPAFDNLRTDDAFWAADLMARFSDEAIRAIVAKARYSDAGASEYIADTLIARRDKVVRTWLTAVNPIVEPTLSTSGALAFKNAAGDRGVASPPASYRLTWSRVDGATGDAIGTAVEERVTQPAAAVPGTVVSDIPGALVLLDLRADHPDFPVWQEPVRVYFRRTAGGWQTVGLERVGRLAGFGEFRDAGNPANAKRP